MKITLDTSHSLEKTQCTDVSRCKFCKRFTNEYQVFTFPNKIEYQTYYCTIYKQNWKAL